jgi:hypothetical protein
MSAHPEISQEGNDIQTDDKNPESQWLLLVHHNHQLSLSVSLTVEPVKTNTHRQGLLISQTNGRVQIRCQHVILRSRIRCKTSHQ